MKVVAVYTTFCVADDADDADVLALVSDAGDVLRDSGLLLDQEDAYSVSAEINPLPQYARIA